MTAVIHHRANASLVENGAPLVQEVNGASLVQGGNGASLAQDNGASLDILVLESEQSGALVGPSPRRMAKIAAAYSALHQKFITVQSVNKRLRQKVKSWKESAADAKRALSEAKKATLDQELEELKMNFLGQLASVLNKIVTRRAGSETADSEFMIFEDVKPTISDESLDEQMDVEPPYLEMWMHECHGLNRPESRTE